MNYFNESYNQETEVKKSYDKTNMQMNNDGGSSCCSCGSGMNMGMPTAMPQYGCSMMPIYECPQERVCHRYVCYDVPHIIPCNTRVINHHVYRHTYRPEYTCCEENVYENVYDRGCF